MNDKSLLFQTPISGTLLNTDYYKTKIYSLSQFKNIGFIGDYDSNSIIDLSNLLYKQIRINEFLFYYNNKIIFNHKTNLSVENLYSGNYVIYLLLFYDNQNTFKYDDKNLNLPININKVFDQIGTNTSKIYNYNKYLVILPERYLQFENDNQYLDLFNSNTFVYQLYNITLNNKFISNEIISKIKESLNELFSLDSIYIYLKLKQNELNIQIPNEKQNYPYDLSNIFIDNYDKLDNYLKIQWTILNTPLQNDNEYIYFYNLIKSLLKDKINYLNNNILLNTQFNSNLITSNYIIQDTPSIIINNNNIKKQNKMFQKYNTEQNKLYNSFIDLTKNDSYPKKFMIFDIQNFDINIDPQKLVDISVCESNNKGFLKSIEINTFNTLNQELFIQDYNERLKQMKIPIIEISNIKQIQENESKIFINNKSYNRQLLPRIDINDFNSYNQDMNKESISQCNLFNTKLFKEFYIDIFYNRKTYFDIFEFINFIKNEKYFENIEMRYITKYLFDTQPYYYMDSKINKYELVLYYESQIFSNPADFIEYFDFQLFDFVQSFLFDSTLFNVLSFEFIEKLDSLIDNFFNIYIKDNQVFDKFYELLYNFMFITMYFISLDTDITPQELKLLNDNKINYYYQFINMLSYGDANYVMNFIDSLQNPKIEELYINFLYDIFTISELIDGYLHFDGTKTNQIDLFNMKEINKIIQKNKLNISLSEMEINSPIKISGLHLNNNSMGYKLGYKLNCVQIYELISIFVESINISNFIFEQRPNDLELFKKDVQKKYSKFNINVHNSKNKNIFDTIINTLIGDNNNNGIFNLHNFYKKIPDYKIENNKESFKQFLYQKNIVESQIQNQDLVLPYLLSVKKLDDLSDNKINSYNSYKEYQEQFHYPLNLFKDVNVKDLDYQLSVIKETQFLLDDLSTIDELENILYNQLYDYQDKSFNINNSSLFQELDDVGLYQSQYTLKINELTVFKDLTNYFNSVSIFDYDKKIKFSDNLRNYLINKHSNMEQNDFNKIEETDTLIDKWKINLDNFNYLNYNQNSPLTHLQIFLFNQCKNDYLKYKINNYIINKEGE